MRTAKTLIRLGGCPADLSLRWAHSHFVGFVMSRLICGSKRCNAFCDKLTQDSDLDPDLKVKVDPNRNILYSLLNRKKENMKLGEGTDHNNRIVAETGHDCNKKLTGEQNSMCFDAVNNGFTVDSFDHLATYAMKTELQAHNNKGDTKYDKPKTVLCAINGKCKVKENLTNSTSFQQEIGSRPLNTGNLSTQSREALNESIDIQVFENSQVNNSKAGLESQCLDTEMILKKDGRSIKLPDISGTEFSAETELSPFYW